MARKKVDPYENLTRIEESTAQVKLDIDKPVMPLGISVELPGGYVHQIVQPGIRLPHVSKELFSTSESFQMAAEFHILLGNRPLTCENIDLGRVRVRNIKWSSSGVPRIDLKFHIAEDGTLTFGADNLDRANAEVIVFLATDTISHDALLSAQTDAEANKEADEAMRALIERMLKLFVQIGSINDAYAVAKRGMSFAQKRAYKKARKRLNNALQMKLDEVNDTKLEELDAAEEDFRAQSQTVLQQQKRVMNWYR